MSLATSHTVAIIPARGGSKGIPRKNVIEFGGHPLLSWSVCCARRTRGIRRVFVSTDDPEIKAVALRYGAEVILRPEEISGDAATSESALLHALKAIGAAGYPPPDRIIFLQATSPLREPSELDDALDHFEREGLDSLFSAATPEDLCLWREDGGKLESLNYDFRSRKRRQDGNDQRLWIETGSFYILKPPLLVETGNRLAGKIGVFPVPLWKSHEIDSPEGLELCSFLARLHQLELPVIPP